MDCITLWHVLEHVSDLTTLFENMNRVLSPNGRIVIAVPNFLSWDAKYYENKWAAYDVPRHLWHFSPKAVERIFSEVGFVLVKKAPMLWDAFYVSMLSEKINKRKPSFLFGLINGIRSNWHARRTGMYSSLQYEFKKRT
jgi:SAM-dependent methyltransferase